MKQVEKKAVFFDIDGTLLEVTAGHKSLTPAVRQAILELRMAGHHTFIASGRPLAYIDPELTQSSLFDGMVLMNGAAVMLDGKVIFEQPLPRERVDELIALCEREHIQYILQGVQHVYLRPEFRELADFYRSIYIDADRFVRDFDPRAVATCKLEFWTPQPEKYRLFEPYLALPELTGLRDPYHAENMEMYGTAVSKGSGILQALRYLHLPRSASYAFGDGLNDLEMMKTVGTAFAMGNGRPEVKALADYTVPGVREDGVSWGIENVILADG